MKRLWRTPKTVIDRHRPIEESIVVSTVKRFAVVKMRESVETGQPGAAAEGATAPESLRPRDRILYRHSGKRADFRSTEGVNR